MKIKFSVPQKNCPWPLGHLAATIWRDVRRGITLCLRADISPPCRFFLLPGRSRQGGAALVVVLAFVVLLTGLVLAFLANAVNNRTLAGSSVSQTKAELFAQGVADTIISDLKQEIVLGSTNTVVTTGNVTASIYRALAPANVVPALVGSTGDNGLENLVKRSVCGQPFCPGGASRASVSSSTNVSLNGRSITAARWNKPLLLPATSVSDLTPLEAVGFIAPDWILVARDGSNPPNWSANMKASASNSTMVVARYAYTIYDEGGLLDANVAGHPANTPAAQIGAKTSLAYADLMQLGGNASLTQIQNDNFIGWRNYASARPDRSDAGKHTFDSASASNYCNAVNSNSTGFLAVGNRSLNGGESDRMFASRQQLIQFFMQKLGGGSKLQAALQYLGTFSRCLNQPSFSPDPDRPRIQSPGALSAAGTWDRSAYRGGNDACGLDNNINPSFLSERAKSPFTRNDGAIAVVGEPLVKKRFDLRRLAWLTYKGPSSSRAMGDADMQQVLANGISAEFLARGTDANILSYFGLAWDAGGYWTYAHGSPNGHLIGRLEDLDREPDFFELIKASINAGSLGKSAASGAPSNLGGAYQHCLDISTEYQLIQIGANIIDQSDADGFPTSIIFNSKEFSGVENLPALYRTNYSWAYESLPDPLLGSDEDYRAVPVGTVLRSPGNAALYLIPNMWNIHDQNDIAVRGAAYALGNPRPDQLRIVANTSGPNFANPWEAGAKMRREPVGPLPQIDFPSAIAYRPLAAENATLSFSDGKGTLFREPTRLWKVNLPDGSNLASSMNATVDRNDKTQRVGFYVGSVPVEEIYTPDVPTGTSYIIKPNNMMFSYSATAEAWFGCSGAMTFQTQYCDGSGNWHNYDVKYWDFQGVAFACTPNFYSADPANNGQLYSASGNALGNDMMGWDPRSARFNMDKGEAGPKTCLDYRGSTLSKDFCVVPTARPGTEYIGNTQMCGQSGGANSMFYDTPSYDLLAGNRGNSGMGTQNSPWVVTANSHHQFNADADGVVRRAMGAYVPVSAVGATTSSIGLAQATATAYVSGTGTANATQSLSRPMILNRPFKTVDELSYTFKGTPYKNLDFFTPESGDAALLDVFCVGDNSNPDGLAAGKINLNTRQIPVLVAVLSGAMYDELTAGSLLSAAENQKIAAALVARTTGTNAWQGPLSNVGELVGRFVGRNVPGVDVTSQGVQTGNGAMGNNYYACNYESPGSNWGSSGNTMTYSGLSADLDKSVFTAATHKAVAPYIQRLRQSAIRPLVACGQTRVWNLMIDFFAQTGRYPQSAASLSNFIVEAEKRYWLHVAIDRFTGQIIDSQLESVTE